MKTMVVGFTEERDNYEGAERLEMTPEEVASVHLSYAMSRETGHKLVVGWFSNMYLNHKWLCKVNGLCHWVKMNWREV